MSPGRSYEISPFTGSGKKTGLRHALFDHFKMARRVKWLGKGRKTLPGDCIALTFSEPALVYTIFRRAGSISFLQHGINVLPLGAFYPPKQFFKPQTFNDAKVCNLSPVNIWNLPLQNRFDILNSLEEQD